MPRWPAGLHVASGSLRAVGGRDRRISSPDVAGFWHQQVGDLFAAAGPVRVNGGGQAAALAGPQGLGEKWDVQLVQVSSSSPMPLLGAITALPLPSMIRLLLPVTTTASS